MITGSCLCGEIAYEIDGRISYLWYCHCSRCRKASGAAFMTGAVCRPSRFRWRSGRASVAEFRENGGYRTRFCPRCGSAVPIDVEGGSWVWLPVGTTDGDPGTRLRHHIFVGSKAPWFEIGDGLPQFVEGADVP